MREFRHCHLRARQLMHFMTLAALLSLFYPVMGLNFRWTASICRSSGIATSRETSIVPASSNLHRTFHSSRSREALVKDTFQRYPSWLAGWRVTFGCLRADLVRNKSREEQEIAIKDALFGVTLLSFGQGKPSKRHQRRHCQIEYNYMLPIVGGFMTMTSPEDSCGALSFSLISTCRDDNESFVLETSVSGYRPKFAGPAPVSRLRAGIYRSTQSMVHAYVMWRFHHYCYHQTS